MRYCLRCSQLIQDAAVYCRFCHREVVSETTSSERWTSFGEKFHQLSATQQQTVWDQLDPGDRTYAQKVLGIVPPAPARTQEAVSPSAQRRRTRRSGAAFGFFMVVSLSLLLIGGYLGFRIIEAPGGDSKGVSGQSSSVYQRIDRVFIGAWETVTSAVADLGEAAADSVSNAVGSIASDAHQGEAQGLLDPHSPYRTLRLLA